MKFILQLLKALILLVILGILVIVGFSLYESIQSTPNIKIRSAEFLEEALSVERPSKSEYIDADKTIFNYRSGMHDEYPKNSKFILFGEVLQIVNDKNVRLYVNAIGESVYISFSEKPKIIEGDTLTVFARYRGTYKYISALQTEVTIPYFTGDYFELEQEQ